MYIKREYYLEIIRRYYDSNLIKVLSGVRRCGESVLLSRIKDEILYLGKANEEHIIFINLEDFKFMSLNNANKLNSYIYFHPFFAIHIKWNIIYEKDVILRE